MGTCALGRTLVLVASGRNHGNPVGRFARLHCVVDGAHRGAIRGICSVGAGAMRSTSIDLGQRAHDLCRLSQANGHCFGIGFALLCFFKGFV